MTLDRAALRQIARDIPVVILAGGLGTRFSEETAVLPKPMIEVGGLPIVVHIMDYYAKFGFTKFFICGGYKVEAFRSYFMMLPFVGKDVEIRFAHDSPEVHSKQSLFARNQRQHWEVTILETGLHAMTGARVAKALTHLKPRQPKNLCVTYGDGLTDADLHAQLDFHLRHGRIGTLLGVHQPTRFGLLEISAKGNVQRFAEKPRIDNEYINGGYFLFQPEFQRYLSADDDQCVLERHPIEVLAAQEQLMVFKHEGFWQCMDNKREKTLLEDFCAANKAPWLQPVPDDEPEALGDTGL